MAKAQGSFEVNSWDEETYDELAGGGKLTTATVTQTIAGDIEGTGTVRWLMAYRKDGTARFVGFQHVRGSIAKRQGTFVLETVGEFDGTMATWTATVVTGSGTDDLQGLVGQGTFGAVHGPTATFDLEYRFE